MLLSLWFAYGSDWFNPNKPNGGARREYQPTAYELKNRRDIELKIQKAEVSLAALEKKIEKVEVKRFKDLANEAMQIELLGLLTQQNELMQLIDRLQQQRLRMFEDDNDFITLLMHLH